MFYFYDNLKKSVQEYYRDFPDWGVKIPHVSRPKNKNIKQKRYCNKFNKDFLKQWSTFKQIKKKRL